MAQYQDPAATSPRQQYERDLSSEYGLSGSTVYRKSDNYAFSSAQPFLNEVGAKDFNGLKFDTSYSPNSYRPPQASSPTTTLPKSETRTSDDYIRSLANNYFESMKAPTDTSRKSFESYLDTMKISPEEEAAQTELDNILGSRDLGIAKQRARPIPMELIRGFSQNIAEQANAKAGIQERILERLQGKRKINSDVARARLDYETGLADRNQQAGIALSKARLDFEQGLQDQEYNRSQNALKIGAPFIKYPGSDQVYDAKTMQPVSYEQYKALGGAGVPGMDAFPDVVEVGPEKKEEKHSSIYNEWLDYKKEGGTLSFDQYQTMDANRKKSNINVQLPSLAKEYEYAQTHGFTGTMFDYINAKAKAGKIEDDDY